MAFERKHPAIVDGSRSSAGGGHRDEGDRLRSWPDPDLFRVTTVLAGLLFRRRPGSSSLKPNTTAPIGIPALNSGDFRLAPTARSAW